MNSLNNNKDSWIEADWNIVYINKRETSESLSS